MAQTKNWEKELEKLHAREKEAQLGGGKARLQKLREKGILTVGVVTKPFQFEGQRRMVAAEAGIQELKKHVDTLIVIPNQNLFRIANEKTTFADAFKLADGVLHSGVSCITDLIIREGLADTGGCVLNDGDLMLERVTVSDCRAQAADAQGGGIHHRAGSLTLREAVVEGNIAEASLGNPTLARGGGVYAQAPLVIVGGTAIRDNSAIVSGMFGSQAATTSFSPTPARRIAS